MTKFLASLSGITGLALIAAIILTVYGWIMNLITVVTAFDSMSLAELVLRIAGVFFGILGAGMHFFA